jgi:hypothetical protein
MGKRRWKTFRFDPTWREAAFERQHLDALEAVLGGRVPSEVRSFFKAAGGVRIQQDNEFDFGSEETTGSLESTLACDPQSEHDVGALLGTGEHAAPPGFVPVALTDESDVVLVSLADGAVSIQPFDRADGDEPIVVASDLAAFFKAVTWGEPWSVTARAPSMRDMLSCAPVSGLGPGALRLLISYELDDLLAGKDLGVVRQAVEPLVGHHSAALGHDRWAMSIEAALDDVWRAPGETRAQAVAIAMRAMRIDQLGRDIP